MDVAAQQRFQPRGVTRTVYPVRPTPSCAGRGRGLPRPYPRNGQGWGLPRLDPYPGQGRGLPRLGPGTVHCEGRAELELVLPLPPPPGQRQGLRPGPGAGPCQGLTGLDPCIVLGHNLPRLDPYSVVHTVPRHQGLARLCTINEG